MPGEDQVGIAHLLERGVDQLQITPDRAVAVELENRGDHLDDQVLVLVLRRRSDQVPYLSIQFRIAEVIGAHVPDTLPVPPENLSPAGPRRPPPGTVVYRSE